MTQPSVSIGMPVYNGARYIRHALDSLMKQTHSDFQLLICDDGSTDDTLAICREYAARDSRICLRLNEQRLGGAKNFNRVFEFANGQFFMWAAQDDWFAPTFIEKCLYKLQHSPGAVLALAELVLIDENGNRVSAERPIDNVNIGTEGMDVVQRLHEVFRRTGWWAIYGLIRPEVLRKTKLYRSEFAGDVILIAELLLHGEFAKVNEPLFFYRVRSQQQFTVKHNMQSIDHTRQPDKAAYSGFLRSLVNMLGEADLEPLTRKKIIVDLMNTLLRDNTDLRHNVIQENLADLLMLSLTYDNLHQVALDGLNKKSQGPSPVRWLTLFPETENVHLVKDVGLIPYLMHRQFGCDARIACWKTGEYPYLAREVQGLKLEFLDECGGDSLQAGLRYLQQNAANIDVLHVFHLAVRTLEWIRLYKSLNPRGKVYLKLDVTDQVLHLVLKQPLVEILRLCDLISVETRGLHQRLNEVWPVPVEYIPNGYYDFAEQEPVDWRQKQPVICTVGRIGAPEKANEVLLEAFCAAEPLLPEWSLRLIGPVEPDFVAYVNAYFARNPHLANKVVFTGAVSDRQLLEQEYRQAKVFCLTSVSESFGIVLVEALKNGCFILSTPVGAAMDVTEKGQYGELFDQGSLEQLTQRLIAVCANSARLEQVCRQAPQYALDQFQWLNHCKTIQQRLGLPVTKAINR